MVSYRRLPDVLKVHVFCTGVLQLSYRRLTDVLKASCCSITKSKGELQTAYRVLRDVLKVSYRRLGPQEIKVVGVLCATDKTAKHRQDALPMSGELRSIGCIESDDHGRRCNKSCKGLCNLGSTHPCRRSIEKCLIEVYGAEVRSSKVR